MNKKIKKSSANEPRERINQFIIECMFSKYFEEEKETASVIPSVRPRNDKVFQKA